MVGPVFGPNDSKVPNGIIQFINKVPEPGEKKLPDIGKGDLEKFAEMASLLGMCIDNTNEIAGTIEVTLKINDVMQNIRGNMKQEQENTETIPSDKIYNDMQASIGEIKEKYSEMVAHREAHRGRIEEMKTEDPIKTWLDKQM